MRRKLISLALALVMVLSLVPSVAFAVPTSNTMDNDDSNYTTHDGTITASADTTTVADKVRITASLATPYCTNHGYISNINGYSLYYKYLASGTDGKWHYINSASGYSNPTVNNITNDISKTDMPDGLYVLRAYVDAADRVAGCGTQFHANYHSDMLLSVNESTAGFALEDYATATNIGWKNWTRLDNDTANANAHDYQPVIALSDTTSHDAWNYTSNSKTQQYQLTCTGYGTAVNYYDQGTYGVDCNNTHEISRTATRGVYYDIASYSNIHVFFKSDNTEWTEVKSSVLYWDYKALRHCPFTL